MHSRWNPEARFLNLEVRPLGPFIWAAYLTFTLSKAMASDPFVKKNHLTVPGVIQHRNMQDAAREAAVLYKLASELKPEVRPPTIADLSLC